MNVLSSLIIVTPIMATVQTLKGALTVLVSLDMMAMASIAQVKFSLPIVYVEKLLNSTLFLTIMIIIVTRSRY